MERIENRAWLAGLAERERFDRTVTRPGDEERQQQLQALRARLAQTQEQEAQAQREAEAQRAEAERQQRLEQARKEAEEERLRLEREEHERRMQRERRAESATLQFLQRNGGVSGAGARTDLKMCPRCRAGPIENLACWDLAAHNAGNCNACPNPKCRDFSKNWGDWRTWDGIHGAH